MFGLPENLEISGLTDRLSSIQERIFCMELSRGIETSPLQNMIILLCSSLKLVGITAICRSFIKNYIRSNTRHV